MKFTLATAALAATAVVAAPFTRRQALTDADILQFALTLEHLENVFYKGGLSKFSEADAVAAGFSANYYNNLKYVTHDEEQHVELLTAGLMAAGAKPVAACMYKFPYTDFRSFVGLAAILEGVGVSAYLGAAPAIASKDYLTIAGSILVTEALHESVQRFNLGQVAPANPYGTPLGANEVYTLAAAMITSCPSSNVALPFKAFPTLAATQGIPAAPGITFTFSTTAAMPAGTCYVTFVSGLDVVSAVATVANGMISAVIPDVVMGLSYAILTNMNVTSALTDSMVIAGPAVIEVTPSAPTFDVTIL